MKSALLILRMWKQLFSMITFIAMGFSVMAQCGGPSFPANAEILSNVPEASGYNLVYDLPIPTANQNWISQADVPYSVNNSGALAGSSFTRVAYYLKLESSSLGVQWVWVSMNKFTSDLGRIAIPTGDMLYQQQVAAMNVRNSAGVIRTGVNGNIEFWSSCYTADNSAAVPNASGTTFDFGDAPSGGSSCYGSFQIHDFNAMETLLAYNGWAYTGNTAEDLGIGNCTFCGGYTDYTFASNANFYTVKELYVFVNSQAFQATCNNATLNLSPAGNATLTPAMVTNATVGNCGVQNIQLSKTSFNCTNAGNNTVTVTFTVNGNTSTCTSTVVVQDVTNPVITATGTGTTLSCNPTTAAINAALGTATATDNCGTPTLTVNTTPVVLTGNTYSQTRTWTASDGTNTATASRTVSWPKDITPPVINATGSSLALGCNPTAAAIEAALGTATATDNCGTPTLTVTTAPVVVSGNNRSQTRTWTATDPGSNTSTASRTATWTTNCTANTAHTYPSSVSCDDFNDGAQPLLNVCYKAENRRVTKVSPKYFMYYTNVTAPAQLGPNNSFYVDIIQTKSCPNFKLYQIQGNQVRAYDSRCREVENGDEISIGQGRIKIKNSTPGKIYTISVKYKTKSLVGSTYTGNVAPICENTFVTRITLGLFGSGTIVPNSQGTILAKPDCYSQGHDGDDDDDDDDDDDFSGSQHPIVSTSDGPVDHLTITASPNPATAHFVLSIRSNDNVPVTVRVIDLLGKPVYVSNKVASNSTLRIGEGWLPGTYFAEILQGQQRKVIRLVKQ